MAGLSLQHPWAFVFGLLGNIISFMTHMAPIPTFYRIHKAKSTEGFHSVPYVVAVCSAMLWIHYALIKTSEGLLITTNTAGCIIGAIYIVMYLVYAPKKAKVLMVKILLLLNYGVFGLVLLIPSASEKLVAALGWVCVGISVAQLGIIRRVIRTRSVEYMPFSLSVSLGAFVWFLYGLLINDRYIALANILGFTFAVVHIEVYMFFMNKTPVAAEGKEANKLPATAEEHVAVNVAKLTKTRVPKEKLKVD